MELPIPNHLRGILHPFGDNNSELQLKGIIKCSCGSDEFEIGFVGNDNEFQEIQAIKVLRVGDEYFLLIKNICSNFKMEHLIFDNDYHGWNGYICGGDNREAKRPKTKIWKCDSCEKSIHRMRVGLVSEGKEDFIEEAGDEFIKESWVDAFGWITIETHCINCEKRNPEWISYETM